MKYIYPLIIALGLASSLAAQEKSFGKPEMKLTETTEQKGKTILRYEHESVPEWGYEKPQSDYFFVLPPKGELKGRPLQVVLHSAGHSGEAVLKQSFQKPGWFHNVGLEDQYVLYLDCRKNKSDWWWGAKNDLKDTYKDIYTPAEKRILTTIEWVIEKYQIDRNRIYLSGVSMGGSGSLGIGLCRGDIFAAVNVTVPAGVDHVRTRFFGRTVPEPPVLINFTSIGDPWSKGQEELLTECEKKRYHLVFAHGTNGHSGEAGGYHPAATAFPWRSIRKDEAYAVFTNASTDDKYPGFIFPKEGEPGGWQFGNSLRGKYIQGQIGALFRWKNLKDTAQEFQMELRMVTKEEVLGKNKKRKLEVPADATAEVSLRRLQNFKLGSKKGTWTLKAGGKTLKSGKVSLDANGLLTIGKLPLSNEPAVLTISQ
ncbi:MAG: poly(3-hydroxybutyrate) depolymerase [Cryomorphaceae bacterium]|jgi:poly(3-hydroxybutyrate) depolymerase